MSRVVELPLWAFAVIVVLAGLVLFVNVWGLVSEARAWFRGPGRTRGSSGSTGSINGHE